MGKLRDAMQRDMELKNFSPGTMECYLYWMSRYALHYRKPPDELGDNYPDTGGYETYIPQVPVDKSDHFSCDGPGVIKFG